MELNEDHKKTLIEAAAGLLAVLASAVIVDYLAPESPTGQIVRFIVPLTVGLIIGAKIYLRELGKLEERLEEDS